MSKYGLSLGIDLGVCGLGLAQMVLLTSLDVRDAIVSEVQREESLRSAAIPAAVGPS